MPLVESWQQIAKNIRKLESARNCADESLRIVYLSLVKHGTCFVVYETETGPAFAPSKFIGYVDNELLSHVQKRNNRDGRDTNKAIKIILGFPPLEDTSAENVYFEFCRRIGVEPTKTGAFGAARKFWVMDELRGYFEDSAVREIQNDQGLTETEKEQLVNSRIGQGQFRKNLITYWRKCCLTGCSLQNVLRASHIKPWSKSNNKERLDKFNGLLLTPNADALFDQGYISFSDAGELLIYSQLSKDNVKKLLGDCERKISLTEAHKEYVAYHRNYRFRGGETPTNKSSRRKKPRG